MKEYIKEWNAMVISIKDIRESVSDETLQDAFIHDIVTDVEDRAPEAV